MGPLRGSGWALLTLPLAATAALLGCGSGSQRRDGADASEGADASDGGQAIDERDGDGDDAGSGGQGNPLDAAVDAAADAADGGGMDVRDAPRLPGLSANVV